MVYWLISETRRAYRRVRADLIEVSRSSMVYHQSTSTLFWIPHSNMNKRPLTEKESCTCGPARLRQHFFSERVVNIWNKLNYNTVCASSLNSFKNHLDNMYKDGSSSGLCQSAWPSRPSQSPGEALSGKLSVKYFCRQITHGSHHYYFFAPFPFPPLHSFAVILNVDTISFLTYSYTYQYLPTMPFALVRWVNGVEKGTHTVLDANWLMDVDMSSFDNSEGRLEGCGKSVKL